jgi:methylated-DNA-[protein]-cysteine S-methyltransferase
MTLPRPEVKLREAVMSSPVGGLRLVASDAALTRVDFLGPDAGDAGRAAPDSPLLELAMRQLDDYFRGALREFSVPLAPAGTEFQRAVWAALRSIPFGTTTTYGEIARRIARPAAVRAVGAANGANPIPIIIPCHRVIGGDGSLTGFGGGIPVKRYLLELEGVAVPERAMDLQRRLFGD